MDLVDNFEKPNLHSYDNSSWNAGEILSRYASRNSQGELDFELDVHSSFVDLFAKYARLAFDDFTPIFERSFIQGGPWQYCQDFFQIGIVGDGSEVLIRRSKSDPKVYLAGIDESLPSNPRVIAESLDDYLKNCVLRDAPDVLPAEL